MGKMSGGKAKHSRRRSVFKRDNYRCVWCTSESCLTLDHIIPRSVGGPDAQTNLQTLCRACNNRRGDLNVGKSVLPPAYFKHILSNYFISDTMGYVIYCSCGHSVNHFDYERVQCLATEHRLKHLPSLDGKGAKMKNTLEFSLTAEQIAALAGLTLADR